MTVARGGGRYELVNLFALVDTHQIGLHFQTAVGDPPELNDEWITRAVGRADVVVVGWGDGKADDDTGRGRKAAVTRRAREVWPMVRYCHPMCFGGPNKAGTPPHPLYLKDGTSLASYLPPT
jgi:hypothetical protein